jgi:hypothetical protein
LAAERALEGVDLEGLAKKDKGHYHYSSNASAGWSSGGVVVVHVVRGLAVKPSERLTNGAFPGMIRGCR